MGIIEIIIKAEKGKYTSLDRSYQEFILKMDSERVEIYNAIVNELVILGKLNEFKKLKYTVITGGCVNDAVLEIINRNTTLELYRVYILEFINQDWLNQFFI